MNYFFLFKVLIKLTIVKKRQCHFNRFNKNLFSCFQFCLLPQLYDEPGLKTSWFGTVFCITLLRFCRLQDSLRLLGLSPALHTGTPSTTICPPPFSSYRFFPVVSWANFLNPESSSWDRLDTDLLSACPHWIGLLNILVHLYILYLHFLPGPNKYFTLLQCANFILCSKNPGSSN